MIFDDFSKATTLPNIARPIIYFLLDGDEVVYVGQSKVGISRAFSHTDKKFTRIAMIFCEESKLDYYETEYIRKYKPRYNAKVGACDISVQAIREYIRQNTKLRDATIRDARKIVRQSGVKTYVFNDLTYVSKTELDKIVSYISKNY